MLFHAEPTGSMDTQTELYFIEHLKTALAPDQALVVATHRHNMLSILTRLIVIDGGKILADGPRDEVLRHLSAPKAQPKAAE
jgi:ATP-binding cassette subfamily C protein LapB